VFVFLANTVCPLKAACILMCKDLMKISKMLKCQQIVKTLAMRNMKLFSFFTKQSINQCHDSESHNNCLFWVAGQNSHANHTCHHG